MRKEEFRIWEEGEYSYPLAYGFVPKLMTYIHQGDEPRDCMLVVPGGGYGFVSSTEAEPVALSFYSQGMNCFVLTYTTNVMTKEPLMLQPLKDLSRAIRLIRSRAEEFHIHADRLAIVGFSAGGHLCASSAVHHMDIEDTNPAYAGYSCRPDAAVLSYPVITSGEKAHRGSFDNLIGVAPTAEDLRYMSLETQVTEQVPPCFLWHTADDELVPVENSYMFSEALKEKGIPYALHIFSHGHHGLSTADDIWADRQFGGTYTGEQNDIIARMVEAGEIPMEENAKEEFIRAWKTIPTSEYFMQAMEPDQAHPEVAVWPMLAGAWLKTVWGK